MQKAEQRIELALRTELDLSIGGGCPPGLAAALEYTLFPGGHRLRPKLCLAIAAANGDSDPVLSDAAAVAIEFLHCASLVHDDMPCFDDADIRRGKPSVHKQFGEQLALLCGDALIVAAFQTLGRAATRSENPDRLASLIAIVGAGVGAPGGICAGQAWECEPAVDVSKYHRAKTGALFVAAADAGAAAAGKSAKGWANLGQCIGEAYQVADDINDATQDAANIGKPVGKDAALGRPSAVQELGLTGAIGRLKQLVADGVEGIPECVGKDFLRVIILEETKRFLPKSLRKDAA